MSAGARRGGESQEQGMRVAELTRQPPAEALLGRLDVVGEVRLDPNHPGHRVRPLQAARGAGRERSSARRRRRVQFGNSAVGSLAAPSRPRFSAERKRARTHAQTHPVHGLEAHVRPDAVPDEDDPLEPRRRGGDVVLLRGAPCTVRDGPRRVLGHGRSRRAEAQGRRARAWG